MAEPVATMADLTDLERKVLIVDKASLQCGTLGVLGLHPGACHLSAGAGQG
jgi:hypothetical protein